MTNTTDKRPTHLAYAVTTRAGRKYWRAIGAAWQHADGEGFSLKLDYLPLDGADIVIRTPRSDDATVLAEGGAK
jgi:hypothetical protein